MEELDNKYEIRETMIWLKNYTFDDVIIHFNDDMI